jgi:uncharacterized membrane protein YedE/YeeE
VPYSAALAGGLLIGASSVLLYGLLGRIAGISGIAYGFAWGENGERAWRLAFLLGLAGGGWLALLSFGMPALQPHRTPLWLAAVAGLLVGFGTQMSSGCTSGHGICGLARLSPRSLAAVIVFMLVGVAAASLLRPWLA